LKEQWNKFKDSEKEINPDLTADQFIKKYQAYQEDLSKIKE
jgi:hypothetical protein